MNPLEPRPWGPLPEDPAERETECARRAGYHAAKAWLDPERRDMYRYGYRYYNARSNGLYEASAPAVGRGPPLEFITTSVMFISRL